MVKNNTSCQLSQINAVNIDNIKETMNTGFKLITKKLDHVDKTQTELFNHQSTWWSPEQVQEFKSQKNNQGWMIAIICVLVGVLGSFVVAAIIVK